MRAIDISEWDTYMKCMLVGRNAWDNYDRGYTDALDQMDDWLDAQPSLTLDDLRPKGRWEEIEETSSGWKQHRCSLCKAEAIFEYTYIDDYDEGIDGEWEYIGQIENGIIEHLTDFCPNCGADMRGGDTR